MSTPAFVIGNITRTPQLSHTGDGTPVVNLSLAENTRRLVDGEWVDGTTTYWEVVCFVRPAGREHRRLAASLPRGARAIAVGTFRTRTWRGDDGGERFRREIVADEVGPSLRWAPPRSPRPRLGADNPAPRTNRSSGQPLADVTPVDGELDRGGGSDPLRLQRIDRRRTLTAPTGRPTSSASRTRPFPPPARSIRQRSAGLTLDRRARCRPSTRPRGSGRAPYRDASIATSPWLTVGGFGTQSAMFSRIHLPAARVDSSAPALSWKTLTLARPPLCVSMR